MSLIGIILSWGFLNWEFLFIADFFVLILVVVRRIEALNLYGSRWALSEDSRFKSYPSQPEVYLVKNVVQ